MTTMTMMMMAMTKMMMVMSSTSAYTEHWRHIGHLLESRSEISSICLCRLTRRCPEDDDDHHHYDDFDQISSFAGKSERDLKNLSLSIDKVVS